MMTALVYDDSTVTEYEDLQSARAASETTWVHVEAATAGEVSAVADVFDLHQLTIEDVRNGVRAKTEEFSEYTFVLLKTAVLAREETTFEEEIRSNSVGIFVGDDWVVTVAPDGGGPVDRVLDAVRRGDERLLHRGADFTAYRVVDVLVDSYFDLLDRLESKIEDIEDEVVVSTDIETLERINNVRRELLSFRKLLWPAREAVGVLARGDPPQIREATEKYYRDVYDHLVQLVDLTETYRDLVSGARDIYLNTLSQSTNEIMKVLTVVATIFIPLTFVVGVYGMNFSDSPYNMPELTWQFGYPAVMLGMFVVSVVLVAFFRHREYL
ncbi:magnesium/cobalt transporter CorA [Haloarculaceae archaeon H-GB2-1]|nr:magnesium/cobalt transporter CorA [Haloarculaceae archaeon H-GB1-1]MEA5407591.1 magnesium/cobalt transporter CorA [Haloarculaceae archaeon H-GB2-1]